MTSPGFLLTTWLVRRRSARRSACGLCSGLAPTPSFSRKKEDRTQPAPARGTLLQLSSTVGLCLKTAAFIGTVAFYLYYRILALQGHFYLVMMRVCLVKLARPA